MVKGRAISLVAPGAVVHPVSVADIPAPSAQKFQIANCTKRGKVAAKVGLNSRASMCSASR
jgi:hypothetical protein